MKYHPWRVVDVSESTARMRPLTILELIAYHLSYGVGWLAARIFRRG